MTDVSKITLPGSVPNVIDQATDKTTLKPNTKAENYELYYLDGALRVTAAAMGIAAFDAEKFYDAEPTNVTWVVTNATGGVISDATISLRVKGTDPWIPAADFARYVDTTNVTVEVKAEKAGFTSVTAEATVLVKPRPVTLVAGSTEKVYDGTPLTCDTFTVKEDTATEGYGFVGDEGVSSVTMTDDSAVTDPGSVPNEIASETAKANTKLERNYVVTTEPGTLTVTAASPEIPEEVGPAGPWHELPPGTNPPEPHAFDTGTILSTNDWISYYDGEPHTILTNRIWEAIAENPLYAENNPQVQYSLDGTDWQDAPFAYTDVVATSFWYRITADNCSNYYHAAGVTILPRVVVLHAEDAFVEYGPTNVFQELRQEASYEDAVAETNEAVNVYGANPPDADSMGFAAGDGVASVPMTAESVLAEPGTHSNVIDETAVTFGEGTNPDNYVIFFLPGTLQIVQRQDEVHRDPEIVVPPEAHEVLEQKDEETRQILEELVKDDPAAETESYIKYQVTVTPTNHLDETTHTSPEQAAADVQAQIELIGSEQGEIDEVKFLDVVLERTYDKSVAEAPTYNQQDWEPMDDAAANGRDTIVSVTVPVDVPVGMELVAVTRSCHKVDGTVSHGLLTKIEDPSSIGSVEGFVYDPETKTVTLYAYDFCVFGFHFQQEKKKPCKGICSWVDLGGADPADPNVNIVYDFTATFRTTRGLPGMDTVDFAICNLGHDNGAPVCMYWYQDPSIVGNDIRFTGQHDTLTDTTYGDVVVPNAVTPPSAIGRHLLVDAFAFATINGVSADPELVKRLFAQYMAGKYEHPQSLTGAWCASFVYRRVVPGQCYRVPGVCVLTGSYVLNQCCCAEPSGGQFVEETGALPDLQTELLNVFGAWTRARARHVEVVGRIGTDGTVGIPRLHFAGQGMLANLFDSRRQRAEGISFIAGNIVGKLPASRCIYNCCRPSTIAGAFKCDDTTFCDGGDELLDTVAFGTFLLRFNAAKTTFR